jgi:Ca-activated chloride channel family protein
VFPFGFGYDVNTTLLDKLGMENAGMADYVQPKEDLEVKVSNFFSRVSAPVLSDLELDMGRAETEFVYPRKPGDLFKGMQIAMIGRYKNAADLRDATVTLRGKMGKEARSFSFDGLDLPLRSDDSDFLPRLWASRRVGWLLDQIRLNGETKELKDEVVELGTRYGLVTPYTSYLATDGSLNNTRDRVQLDGLSRAAPKAMAAESGAGAVQFSVQQNARNNNFRIAESEKKDARERVLVDNSAVNQFVANKNFFNQNNVWVDSEFSADAKLKEVTVKFGSEEYFKLAASDGDLAKFLSLGEEVVVVWKGRVYRVTR